jgi:hypothetical protein
MSWLRPVAAGAVICIICIAFSACESAPQRGMAERCADLMKQAYPGADIDITKRTASATSLTTIVARVDGDRTNLPPQAAIARHLAVECRFDNNILTAFRWTAGPN